LLTSLSNSAYVDSKRRQCAGQTCPPKAGMSFVMRGVARPCQGNVQFGAISNGQDDHSSYGTVRFQGAIYNRFDQCLVYLCKPIDAPKRSKHATQNIHTRKAGMSTRVNDIGQKRGATSKARMSFGINKRGATSSVRRTSFFVEICVEMVKSWQFTVDSRQTVSGKSKVARADEVLYNRTLVGTSL
jgi:hypothetical protein